MSNLKKMLDFYTQKSGLFNGERICRNINYFRPFKYVQINMVFTDLGFKYFSLLQSKVRTSLMNSQADTVFEYKAEPFFDSYKTIRRIWQHRESQRQVSSLLGLSRNTIKEWEESFVKYGAIGLMQIPIMVETDSRLEKLVVLLKAAYPHCNIRNILTLAQALNLPGASIEHIRRIQRSHGYGQRQDASDERFYSNLQKVKNSARKKHK